MRKQQKVVLVSFYDKTCMGVRVLSAILKEAGHTTYLLILKDDRSATSNEFKKNTQYFQSVHNLHYVCTGEDVNMPSEEEIDITVRKMQDIQPDVIAFSGRSVTKDMCKGLVKRLREVLPGVRYIGGGFGPWIEPMYYLNFLDYVCLGEGDKAILKLVELEDPDHSENVAIIKNCKLSFNKLAPEVDLDTLPFADWSFENKYMVEDNKILPLKDCYDTEAYYLFASRGCPSTCTYCQSCQWPSLYSKYDSNISKTRLRSPQNVIDELLFAKKEYNVKSVKFMDSIFGYNKKWFFEFMDLYDKHINLRFHCLTDARFNDEKVVERMVRSGLTKCVVGIQGTTEHIRKDILGRNVTNEHIIRFAKVLVKHNMPIRYDIIHWNPYDSNETLAEGADFLRKLPKGEHVEIFVLKTYPGSWMTQRIQKENPVPLSDEDFEYWLWIYQLILRSKETEEIADFAMKYNCFRKNPKILRDLLGEASSNMKTRYRLFASRDIEKGELASISKFAKKKSDLASAIEHEAMYSLAGKVFRKEVKKDQPITVNDIYGSYENKYGAVV